MDLHAVCAVKAGLVNRIGGFQRDGIAAPAQALQGGFAFVHQRDHNIARVGRIGFTDDHGVAVQDAGIDHGIAGDFEGVMFAAAQKGGGHGHVGDAILQGLDGCARRNPSDKGHHHAVAVRRAAPPDGGNLAGIGGQAVFRPHIRTGPSETMRQALSLGARGGRAHAFGRVIGQADDFQRPGALFQSPDIPAFFQCRDQPVNARFRFEVQCVLHLVERRRHAGFAYPFMDEHQQLVLLLGQHETPRIVTPPKQPDDSEQIQNIANRSTLVHPNRQRGEMRMKQRISLIPLGFGELAKACAFYQAWGWAQYASRRSTST